MSDDEKNNLNGGEGDPEEAKLVSELLKKKDPKSADAGNKNIFSKKLFGTPAPTSQPKIPSPKPPVPIPPKQTVSQPPKTAPTSPTRPPQTPPTPAQKRPTPSVPTPAAKPPITQAKPSQPSASPPTKPATPPPQPKVPQSPKFATTPSPPAVRVEEEEEEDVKIVTPEDFDKIGHTISPLHGNGLKVEGTGTKDLVSEEFEEEEDFPELVSSVTPSAKDGAERKEETTTLLGEEEKTAQGGEATSPLVPVLEPHSVSEPESWELENPVDEGASLEELATFVVTSKPVTEEIPLKPEREPVVLKAAKDKEGPSAIEETKELIEKLDGLDEGFLDVAEVKRGLKLLEELALKVKELEERLSALEESKR